MQSGTGRENGLDRQQIWSKLKANNTFTQFWLNLLRGKDRQGYIARSYIYL